MKAYKAAVIEKLRETDEWKGGYFTSGLSDLEKKGAVVEVKVGTSYPRGKALVWMMTQKNPDGSGRGHPYEFDVKTLKLVNLLENKGLGKRYGIGVDTK